MPVEARLAHLDQYEIDGYLGGLFSESETERLIKIHIENCADCKKRMNEEIYRLQQRI